MISRVLRIQRLRWPFNLVISVLVALFAPLSFWLGQDVGLSDLAILRLIVVLIVGGGVTLVIWRRPYVGLVVTAASLPLRAILPEVPFATSIISALGGLALISCVFHRKGGTLFSYGPEPQLVLSGLFILWVFVSSPMASLFGVRDWLWTWAQLWTLLWLASELLTPGRHRLLMQVFLAACIISAIAAFLEARIAGVHFGTQLVRGKGFAGNPNILAGYLTLGLIFALFLHRQSRHWWANVTFPGAYVALVLGVVSSISRSGFLALLLALVLIFGLWSGRERRTARRLTLLAVALVIAAQFLIPIAYWQILRSSFSSSEIAENQNLGGRLELMNAAVHIWIDHPIMGVGIGRFAVVNKLYLPESHMWGLYAHNLYLNLLAETGLVGFFLFSGWLVAAVRDLWLASRGRWRHCSAIALVWLTAILVYLFKGLTASDMHYDKMLWLMGGVSIALRRATLGSTPSGWSVDPRGPTA